MIRVAARMDKAATYPEIWDSRLICMKKAFRGSDMIGSPGYSRVFKKSASDRDPALRSFCKGSHISEYAALSKTPRALADASMLVFQYPAWMLMFWRFAVGFPSDGICIRGESEMAALFRGQVQKFLARRDIFRESFPGGLLGHLLPRLELLLGHGVHLEPLFSLKTLPASLLAAMASSRAFFSNSSPTASTIFFCAGVSELQVLVLTTSGSHMYQMA